MLSEMRNALVLVIDFDLVKHRAKMVDSIGEDAR
jgi:hypothetical protein